MTWHVPENELVGQAPYAITVLTARSIGVSTLIVDGWPSAWTTFPKLLIARRGTTLLAIFEVTGISFGALQGVTAMEGTADVALQVGDTLSLGPTKLALTELQSALDTNTSAIAALVALEATTLYSSGSYSDPAWLTHLGGKKVVERDALLAYDDFSAYADGPLSTALSGQSWIQNTIGGTTTTAAIAGGTMGVTTFVGASYPTLDLGAGIKPGLVWASWTVASGASPGTTSIGLLVSAVNPIDLGDIMGLIHVVYSDTSWTLGIYTSGTLSGIGSGTYLAPLVADGATVNTAGLRIVGSTITLFLPDGTIKAFTDSRIGSMNGRYVTFEPYVPGGPAGNVRFTRIAVFSRTPGTLPLAHPAEDDLWTASAPLLAFAASRASTGANTFTDIQTIFSSGGGLVFKQDASVGARWLMANTGSLYFQTTANGFSTVASPFTINMTTGAFAFGVAPTGDGSALSGIATLGANTFTGIQTIFSSGGGIVFKQDASVGARWLMANTGSLYFQATANGFSTVTSPFTIDMTTGSFAFGSAPLLPALADGSAPNGSIYLSTSHLDGAGAPKLCRKDGAGNVNVIG